MRLTKDIVGWSVHHPGALTSVMVAVTLGIAVAAAVPSLWPPAAGLLNPIAVDTDPENMLAADEPVRVFHDRMKERFGLHDMVVVGVVNESDPCGVFTPGVLGRVHELTRFAEGLRGDRLGEGLGPDEGVIAVDLIAPSAVDAIEPVAGGVSFSWLMPQPPEDANAALEVWRKARRIPFLFGTLIADTDPNEPPSAVALYLPLTRKDLSHSVYVKLLEKIAAFEGPEEYHITGLPVAEDTFGVEMFIQMAISAPSAMAVIFVLMLLFFRKLVLVVSPMIVAMVSVIVTMGSLVIAGFPVHIMSSMIPIFIMPIAVLDSIHIISEFFERYQATRDREKTIRGVMKDLFVPMLYTSLTSAAGFASLALTPIPPVQVFGVFVGLGIMVAWLLTITFIPAFVMFLRPETLENFGATHAAGEDENRSVIGRALQVLARGTNRHAKPILAAALIVLAVAGYGISRIRINDNPVKWFTPSHPIRVADRVLNRHFGGTYMAYLALESAGAEYDPRAFAGVVKSAADARRRRLADANTPPSEAELAAVDEAFADLKARAGLVAAERPASREAFLNRLAGETPGGDEAGDAPGPARPPGTGEPALPTVEQPEDDGGGPALPEVEPADEPALPAIDDSTAPETRPGAEPAEAFADEQVALLVDTLGQGREIFKRPDVLRWMSRLQEALGQTEAVGKSNSLADMVRTVHRDLLSGEPRDYRIPDEKATVAQCLIQYQNSHRPDDLWHFVTPDYQTASLWVQLTSGDNRQMQRVVEAVDAFVRDNPPPVGIQPRWFGLTYINVVWQDKMVTGMLGAFLGSFFVVLLLMTILFRSPLWGLLSMVPLTVTIAAIYGAVGLIGKDYDMPVAVLSSLTLGLAVDFAIHFLARARAMHREHGSWEKTAPAVFGEPALAIVRNVIVIAAGFLPLLLAPLMPYKTVGILLAVILLVSGAATLLLLPALVRVLAGRLFRTARPTLPPSCNCGVCLLSAAAVVVLVALNIQPYVPWHWTTLTWLAAAVVPLAALICGWMSRRTKCKIAEEQKGDAS